MRLRTLAVGLLVKPVGEPVREIRTSGSINDSIASLAAALAKGRGRASNPQKSLIATIDPEGREGERSFRYSPLSSGLDIVRKALGQQQTATLQTTGIDAPSGMISLTTILAHASGEWIASDWPVRPIAQTAAPR